VSDLKLYQKISEQVCDIENGRPISSLLFLLLCGEFMSEVQDYMIHQFLMKNNGKATRQEIIRALGKDIETKRTVEEKISMMARFGIVTVDGDLVTVKRREKE